MNVVQTSVEGWKTHTEKLTQRVNCWVWHRDSRAYLVTFRHTAWKYGLKTPLILVESSGPHKAAQRSLFLKDLVFRGIWLGLLCVQLSRVIQLWRACIIAGVYIHILHRMDTHSPFPSLPSVVSLCFRVLNKWLDCTLRVAEGQRLHCSLQFPASVESNPCLRQIQLLFDEMWPGGL